MMRPNIRVYGADIIHLQRERKAREEELAKQAVDEEQARIELLAGLVTFGIVMTACALVAVLG